MADGWRESIDVVIREDLPRVMITKNFQMQPFADDQALRLLTKLSRVHLSSISGRLLGPEAGKDFQGWAVGGIELFMLFSFDPDAGPGTSCSPVRLIAPAKGASPETALRERYVSPPQHDPDTGEIACPLALSFDVEPDMALALGKALLESVGANPETTQELQQLADPPRFVISEACLMSILVALKDEFPDELFQAACTGTPQLNPLDEDAWRSLASDTENHSVSLTEKDSEEPQTSSIWYEFRNALVVRDYSTAEALLRETPELIDMTNNLGETALHFLAVEDDLESVRWLCERGAEIDTKNEFGDPMIFEVAVLDHRALFSWFVDRGVNLRVRDSEDRNLVERLMEFGRCEVANWLRESDAWTKAWCDS